MTIADINSEARSLTNTDTISYTAADLLRRVNYALETLVAKIIAADGTWQYDDTNFTTNPRGTGTLVEGQEAYSFSSEYLEIEQINVLDLSNVWRKLKPLDPDDLGGFTPMEYFGGTSSAGTDTPAKGLPEYYDIQGDTIRLYPAPTSTACTLTSGLQVFFKRTADLFTSAQVTTGTKEPGLPSPYHVTLAYMAAIPYCMAYKPERVALYQRKVDEDIRDLIKFYGHRERDRRKVMRMKFTSYR